LSLKASASFRKTGIFADYNLTSELDPAQALAQVKSAEDIFDTWSAIRGQQIAQAYLVSLLVKRA
jgi:hypothetical protein